MASSTRVFGKACRTLMAAAKGPTATATATKAKAKKPEAAAAAAAVKAPSGITKEVPISPALGQFMGSSEASRTGAVKKVWEYIKLNNLQVSLSLCVYVCVFSLTLCVCMCVFSLISFDLDATILDLVLEDKLLGISSVCVCVLRAMLGIGYPFVDSSCVCIALLLLLCYLYFGRI